MKVISLNWLNNLFDKGAQARHFYALPLAYLILALIFFGSGYRGELLDDGLAGLTKFQNQGWGGFAQSFGFTSLYYVHDILVLSVYKVVGKLALGWFAVMIVLHAVNASLIFFVFRKFYALLELRHGALIAGLGSIMFLLSPYQTENVLWAATLHYAVTLLIFLSSTWMLFSGIEKNGFPRSTAIVLILLQVIALLTLEISLVFPFAYGVFAGGVLAGKKSWRLFRQLITGIILPMLCLLPLYFAATRLIKGHWLPHYGEAHLLNNNIQTYATNYARYLIKTLGFVHFASHSTREKMYDLCSHWRWALFAELLVALILVVAFRFRKQHKAAFAFLLLVTLSFVLLLPSLHMFFMYLFNTINDRLGYYFTLAIYQALALVLITLFHRPGIVAASAFIIAGCWLLQIEDSSWCGAGTIQDNCIRSFTWLNAPRVYVLSSPAYFNNVYVFRNDERLPFALNFFKQCKDTDKVVPVTSFSSWSMADSTLVEVKNDSALIVSIKTGGWLMRDDLGATDYSNSDFEVHYNQWQAQYQITLKHKVPGAAYVYYTPSGFKEFTGFR